MAEHTCINTVDITLTQMWSIDFPDSSKPEVYNE